MHIGIGDLIPPHQPPEVMDTATEALRKHHVVEAWDIELWHDMPRVLLRFVVEGENRDLEDAHAWGAVLLVEQALSTVCHTIGSQLKKNFGGKFLPLGFGEVFGPGSDH